MLPSSKITEIFFVIDEFSLVFDTTIKEKSVSDGKAHRNKPYRCPKARLPLFWYYFILADTDV